MFVILLISIFGYFIQKHECEEIFSDFGLRKSLTVKIQVSLILINLISILLLNNFTICLWIFNLFLILILKIMPTIIKSLFENSFRGDLIHFLDFLVLNLQSGMSLKSSLVLASNGFSGWRKTQFQILINHLHFQSKSPKFYSQILKNFYFELQLIEKSQNKMIDQIKSYRRQLKLEQDLRHKSRQLTLNLKIQSMIMSIMYLGVLIFIFSTFDTSKTKNWILISLILFLIGIIFVFTIGKRMKWKV